MTKFGFSLQQAAKQAHFCFAIHLSISDFNCFFESESKQMFIAKELCHHAVYFLKSSCCALEANVQFAAVKKLELFAYMYAYLYIYINLFIYLFWCLFSFKYKYNFTTHSPHIRTAYCIVYTQCKGCPITTKHNCEWSM